MYVVKETQTPIFKSSDVASQHPPNFPAIVPDASSERPPLGEGPFRRSSHFALGPTSPRRERPEEHTSELQSLMRSSYAVFCLKKNNKNCTSEAENTHTSRDSRQANDERPVKHTAVRSR